MFDLLLAYWPVLLLLYVPRLALLVASVIAERTKGTLDHRIPDEMPETAGEWLDRQLACIRIGVRSIVTDKDIDAYRPLDLVIQLRDTTSFKADPVYWATAAHELGHAHNRALYPMIGGLRTAANVVTPPLVAAGVAFLGGYVLYAIALAGTLAFACFAVAAALRVFVLVDEALASIYAYRVLRAIHAPYRRAIRAVLLTAFATYFVSSASYALLLTQWSVLDALAHPSVRYELTTIGWIAAGVLSAASLAAFALRRGLLRWLPITLLVLLVWNVVDPAYAWCVLAAIAASWRVWNALAHAPGALPYFVVSRFVERFAGPGLHETAVYLVKRERGRGLISQGNATLERLRARWHDSALRRAAAATRFGYLPLLVAIWL